ncbi:enoyl-[acyl-carrier-protein] reductase, mitochondrial-like [Agrilus planipennis]|uniref:Enoyl-[acyl-carrier-protein] reductase, mitochondrial n=1 Tax=Agrilus planipennis TaxID=224129 RepID=A0A1W4WTS4_AGRPL|nr:enoyl-[acyl-carrier-protein] reductase, mitochondrial-like [Agrilus planipennis]XP_025837127.1 enoyl-[acyl-carrier-protein] reductase, mitochondrial-like [Agrilus planipennis]
MILRIKSQFIEIFNITLKSNKRSMGSQITSKLVFQNHGPPASVVKLVDEPITPLRPDEVLVKMLAAPINPADINTIEGVYPSELKLPAVPGFEGVGKVVNVGDNIKELKPNDHVVPLKETLGTWRTYAKFPGHLLLKVPKDLGIVQAATLIINPCTAYRMLKDFANLKPGDVIIQNGANSAVGQNVIQIAKRMGLKTVNVVRDRPEIVDLKCTLKNLGAHTVLTEEEVKKTDIFKKSLPKPKLALNCVGGQNALEILKTLQEGCTMVTYGGMSRKPVIAPTSALIFKDVHVKGFWVTSWNKQMFKSKKWLQMYNDLINMMLKKELKVPSHNFIHFKGYKEALEKAVDSKGYQKKFILNFD